MENNWNELVYTKHRFWNETIFVDKKEISVFVSLEIDYLNYGEQKITINTEINVRNNGVLKLQEEEYIKLQNLFKLEKLDNAYLYLIPIEQKMIKIALDYAKNKIKKYDDAEGENL